MAKTLPTTSVQAAPPPLHIQNKFKFYHISWKIEHFFVQTCEENWEICSPELDGPRGARLKLILKSSRNEDIADPALSFVVRRSDSDSGPETLWVNYRVFICDPGLSANQSDPDKLCSLDKGTENEVNISAMSRILDEERNEMINMDSLKIHCEIIIYSEGEDFGLEYSDAGLRSLSEDMLTLFKSSLDYDVELEIGNYSIPLHRSIICTRCEWFADTLKKVVKKKVSEKVTIDLSSSLSDVDYERMVKVLNFMYTGNLKPILEKPSLEMYELATLLNIKEINIYYKPENLEFFSTVDAQEFAFDCSVRDFILACENEVCLSTPCFVVVCSSRTWNFHIYPKKGEETEFGTIYAVTNEEIKSMNVCLEVSVANADGCSLSTKKRLRRHVDSSSTFKIEFECKNWIAYDATSEIVNLNIKIKMSTGKQSSYIRKHLIPFFNADSELTGLKKLSLDMKHLIDNGEFYDADFLVSNDILLAHRCVLAARCKLLYDMVKRSGGYPLHIKGITSASFLVVLNFLYSGCIYEMEDHDKKDVLWAARIFKIPLLAEYCLKFSAPASSEERNGST